MSRAEENARAYQGEQMTQGGVWCKSCMQRMGDPHSHYLAGARALLEWARSKAIAEGWGPPIKEYVKLSDLEAYFAEQAK